VVSLIPGKWAVSAIIKAPFLSIRLSGLLIFDGEKFEQASKLVSASFRVVQLHSSFTHRFTPKQKTPFFCGE